MHFKSNGIKQDDCRLCFTGGDKPIYKMTREEIDSFSREGSVVEVDTRLDIAIDDLNFDVRARNCLVRGGVTTVRQLVGMTEEDLKKFGQLGDVTVAKIKRSLAEFGLTLKGSVAPRRKRTGTSTLVVNPDGSYEIRKVY